MNKNALIYFLLLLFSVVSAGDAIAQNGNQVPSDSTDAATDSTKIESIEQGMEEMLNNIESIRNAIEQNEKSTIRFGLSIAHRYIWESDYEDYYISVDSTLLYSDSKDSRAITLSGVVSVTPFKKLSFFQTKSGLYNVIKNIVFLANINLADFSSEERLGFFNKNIEGGVGMGIQISDDFSVGLTLERVFNRALRSNYRNHIGEPIVVNGTPLTILDKTDEGLFRDDNVSALAMRFTYHF